MQIEKNIKGNDFIIIDDCMTHEQALAVPGKMLRHAEFMRLVSEGFPFLELGICGPFWLETRISCMMRAVMIVQPNGTAVPGRYDKTFLCYYFGFKK